MRQYKNAYRKFAGMRALTVLLRKVDRQEVGDKIINKSDKNSVKSREEKYKQVGKRHIGRKNKQERVRLKTVSQNA